MIAFVGAQRTNGKANDETSRIERAAEALGAGWSLTGIRTAMGRKAPRRPSQLPQCSALLRFCEVADVNAEWLFTGEGSARRSERRVGATVTLAQLATELCAHVLPRCAAYYEVSVSELEVDAERVLATSVASLLELVEADAAQYHQMRTEHHALRLVQDAREVITLRADVEDIEDIEDPVVGAGRILFAQLERSKQYHRKAAIHPNEWRMLDMEGDEDQ